MDRDVLVLALIAIAAVAAVLHAPVEAEAADTIDVLDARDPDGRTVLQRCESPMHRILPSGRAALVCMPSAIVHSDGFEP